MRANGVYYQYHSIPIYTNPPSPAPTTAPRTSSPSPPAPTPTAPGPTPAKSSPPCGTTTGYTTGFNAIDPLLSSTAPGTGGRSSALGATASTSFSLIPPPDFGSPPTPHSRTSPLGARAKRDPSSILTSSAEPSTTTTTSLRSNTCCSGTSSTCRIIVGRSTSPTGPYLDRGGINLSNGGGTILLVPRQHLWPRRSERLDRPRQNTPRLPLLRRYKQRHAHPWPQLCRLRLLRLALDRIKPQEEKAASRGRCCY